MDFQFYERALHELRKRRSTVEGRLLEGAFEKFHEYKFVCGKVRGLNEAEKIIKQLYKDMYNFNTGSEGELEHGESESEH